MTPTARALAFYRELGFTCQVVERWQPQSKRRIDLYNCIDILCCRPGIGIVGVQACAGSSHAARRTKALAEPKLADWLASGGRFEVISFAKQGPRGKRKLWVARRDEVTKHDLLTAADAAQER
jgi:hypothetical protein